MSTRRRLIIGVVVVGVLASLWFGWTSFARISDPQTVMAGIAAIGLVGGLVMGTWWAIAVAPAAVIGMSYVVSAILCAAGCPPAPEDTPLTLFVLQLIYSGGPAALGAAAGTLGRKLASRSLRHTEAPGL